MTLAKTYHYNGPGQGLILAGVIIGALALLFLYARTEMRLAAKMRARRRHGDQEMIRGKAMSPTQNRLLGGLIVLIAGGALIYQSASGSVSPDIAVFSLVVFFAMPFVGFLMRWRSHR